MIIGAKYVLRKGKKAVDYPSWKRVLFSILLRKERTIVAVTLEKQPHFLLQSVSFL